MTDDELICLLAETPLDELSVEQIELLRVRSACSAEVHAALLSQLQFDEVAHASLGRVEVRTVDIYALADRTRRRLRRWAVLSVLLVLAGLASWFGSRQEHEQPPIVAVPSPERPLPTIDTTPSTVVVPPPTPALDPLASKTPAVVPDEGTEKVPLASPKPADDEPWLAALRGPEQSFEQVAYSAAPSAAKQASQGAQIARWFEPIGKGRTALEAIRDGSRRLAMYDTNRLRAPWSSGYALRIAFAPSRAPNWLYLWQGTRGVAFEYDERAASSWAAYQVQRKPGDLEPNVFAFHGHDGDRFRRQYGGVIELRYQQGRVVLSSGDILLSAIDMPQAPTEIVLNSPGNRVPLAITGIELVKSAPFPEHKLPKLAAPVAPQPIDLTWHTTLLGNAKFHKEPDGSVTLSAENLDQPVMVWGTPSTPTLGQCTLCIEGVDPGTGVFVGDEQAKRMLAVGVFSHRRSREPLLILSRLGETTTETEPAIDQQPLPWLGPRQWLRFTSALGGMRVQTSVDGLHWGDGFDGRLDQNCPVQAVGLQINRGKSARQIRLRHVAWQPFTALEQLAPPQYAPQFSQLDEHKDLGSWYSTMLATQPEGLEQVAWRAACAVHTLRVAQTLELRREIWSALLKSVTNGSYDARQRRALLTELSWFVPVSGGTPAREWLDALERSCALAWRQGEPRPYTLLHDILSETPGSAWFIDVSMPGATLAQQEILEQVLAARWDEAADSIRLIRWATTDGLERRFSFIRSPLPKLLNWADALVSRQRQQGETNVAVPSNWRHPLIEQLGKEGYNTLAELEAAVASEAFKDAGQIMSTIAPKQLASLVPDTHDSECFITLPVVVERLVADHPRLSESLQREFGNLAEVRLRQAISDGDVELVTAVTTQFHGTPAAAEAWLWLGDRHLAIGQLAQSESCFKAARRGAVDPSAAAIEARLRLVAAMLGKPSTTTVRTRVRLNDVEFSPGEFEQLVREAAAHVPAASTESTPRGWAAGLDPRWFTARQLETAAWATIALDSGREASNFSRRDLDPWSHQWTTTVDGPSVYMHNRFAISAYTLSDGARLWTRTLDSEPARAHERPLVPFRTVLDAKRIFARRLVTNGPELVCLDRASGELLWRSPRGLMVVSDPVLFGDLVIAVTVTPSQQESVQVSLSTFELATGRPARQYPLMLLRDVWNKELSCQLTLANDALVVTGGGCVIACDLDGRLRWLRRQTWLGGVTDLNQSPIPFEPPVVVDGELFVTQPGVPSVACIELRSGKLRWQRSVPESWRYLRLIAVQQDTVYAQSGDSLLAFAQDDGRVLWQRAQSALGATASLDSAGNVWTMELESLDLKVQRPRFVALNGRDGQPLVSLAVEGHSGERPTLGPLFTAQGRCWAAAGGPLAGAAPQKIVELVPRGERPGHSLADPVPWVSYSMPLADAPIAVAEQWSLLQTGGDRENRPGRFTSWKNETNLFVTVAPAERPAIWTRAVDVPRAGEGTLSLKIRVSNPGPKPWQLEVRANDLPLQSFAVEPSTTGDKTVEQLVDLSAFAGQRVNLFVTQRWLAGSASVAWWKELEWVKK